MSDIASEMMDEWRRTRYIKAAGPSERGELDAFSEALRTTVQRIRAARVELENTLIAIKEARGMMVISPTLTDEEREAVAWAAKAAADPTPVAWYAPQIAATLRGLLERLK